ncbi:hypothetical protein G6F59_016012 [Rhizopus arrhizus]|nr:hypothetical protein G6F59_016012 [Rhizopus arrhizus]
MQLLGIHIGVEHRALGRRARQHFALLVAQAHFGLHRQADAQRVLGQLLGIDGDAHRHALHDLDPVAAGVLRRQQRERRAGAQAQALDAALVLHVTGVQVGLQLHFLAQAHVAQLGFLEVGLDPHLLGRHHGHQGIARLHALADLHRTTGNAWRSGAAAACTAGWVAITVS